MFRKLIEEALVKRLVDLERLEATFRAAYKMIVEKLRRKMWFDRIEEALVERLVDLEH